MIEALLVAIGGFFGAITRFAISNWFKKRNKTSFPIATFLINITGAFLLGYIIGNEGSTSWQLLLGTGFMGAFTTFSTFKLESVQLLTLKKFSTLLLYVSTTYIIGILFAFLGMKLGGI
ncbi:camphor resistance protein CrcB [Bacillus thuringiensis serovar roskildiensis]|uniref:Fluoride-specific ion channel FluC n=1 Tax=Bacillus thuringiensis serovar sooncheon TaxID=180891 RepID=A0A9Q5SHY0_BACTU|nr:fluoride efflux transporter CrcB [Bacillus thuringiensis]OTW69323.1 camphor resistance protein CrcB [Bacillus thuringiensis serovar coreanensis]OTX45522.1 camphor resistance protein CrcB [Bacillus thuringiensis serovar sooncheon]OTX48867.1 camphor resistance protein CrcB [Bacillus thuringiensis serovar guiyangiensis]OTX63888.1 camphor resistance protein CrcB [Bacillus thuringiensis serovar roskildiensis]